MKPFIDELGAKVTSGLSTRVGRSAAPAAAAPASAARASAAPASSAPACEMPVRNCAATAVLLEGGPVRVPFQACCAAALLQGLRGTSGETLGRSG
jgi:hypothetical protein